MQNVAAIPFLWLLPLVVYLLTFILCFDREGMHLSPVWTYFGGAGLAAISWAELQGQLPVRIAIPLFLFGLFGACMYCHSKLVERKPAADHLTYFYLMISAGGAIGSLVVGMLATRLLRGYFELPIGIAVCAFVLLFLEYRKNIVTDMAWTGVAIGAVVAAGASILSFEGSALVAGRNFYGVLRVSESHTASGTARTLVHGSVNHGAQYMSKPGVTTAYYTPKSGVALALASVEKPRRRAGLIGLGVGVLAAYAKPGDEFRFYEINPLVVDYARTQFRFLADCQGKVEIVLGDGRMALEREKPNGFDLLVVDAFSGDSIPVHLLSREALRLYMKHLAPGGILAMHVSNLHLQLAPVVERVGAVDWTAHTAGGGSEERRSAAVGVGVGAAGARRRGVRASSVERVGGAAAGEQSAAVDGRLQQLATGVALGDSVPYAAAQAQARVYAFRVSTGRKAGRTSGGAGQFDGNGDAPGFV